MSVLSLPASAVSRLADVSVELLTAGLSRLVAVAVLVQLDRAGGGS